ncbi:MAG: RidA family protein [Vulcanimicrobiaceae bacterium]
MRKAIRSAQAPAPIGPYSQAIRADGLLFCSGQIPLDPQGEDLVGEDAGSQTAQVLRNLGAILRAAGLDFSDVVKTTIFLVDMADFAAVNTAYEAAFGTNRPARSTVACAALPRGARVEIEAIASFAEL